MLKLGAHMSIAGGVDRALERGASIGCGTVQIFLKNNMQWSGRRIGAAEARRFRERRRQTGIEPVFAHGRYLINLAAINPLFLRRSIAALTDEIRRADLLGVPFIVLHPGAHMGAGEAAGLRTVARSLDTVFRRTARSAVRIALETTAGQGTNLGDRFEHLAEIFGRVKHPERLAVCVDTCHVFAAGYDIRSAGGYGRTFEELDRLVGVGRVVALHLNDSKAPLGSRVDRHQHIGRGRIGLRGFGRLLRDERWRGVPMVLETPKGEDLREDVENLRVLRKLAG
jgi:deoxyribonuclease-4